MSSVEELRSSLQLAQGATVGDDAWASFEGRVARRVRRRRVGQASGVGLLVVAIAAVSVGVARHGDSAGPVVSVRPGGDVKPSVVAVLEADGIHVDGRVVASASHASLLDLAASPDGRYVSWVQTASSPEAEASYVFRYDRMTKKSTNLGNGTAAAWSPTEDTLALVNGQNYRLARPTGPQGYFERDPTPGQPEYTSVVWTPDGLAYALGGTSSVMLGSAQGTPLHPLTSTPPNTIPAAFSPDGKILYAWVNPSGSASIAADGLELEGFRTDGTGAAVSYGTTLVRKDFVAAVPGGLMRIDGEGRDVSIKSLEGPAAPKNQGPGTANAFAPGYVPGSLAFDTESGLIADVELTNPASDGVDDQSRLFVTTPQRAPVALTSPVEHPRAVVSTTGGFVVVGATELYGVTPEGVVSALGPVDGESHLDHGYLDPSSVVAVVPPRAQPPAPSATPTSSGATAGELSRGAWSLSPIVPGAAGEQSLPVWDGSRLLLLDSPHTDADGQTVALPRPLSSYDPSTKEWSTLTPLPAGGASTSAATWTGSSLLAIGSTASYEFRPTEKSWRATAAMPGPTLTRPSVASDGAGTTLAVGQPNLALGAAVPMLTYAAGRWSQPTPLPLVAGHDPRSSRVVHVNGSFLVTVEWQHVQKLSSSSSTVSHGFDRWILSGTGWKPLATPVGTRTGALVDGVNGFLTASGPYPCDCLNGGGLSTVTVLNADGTLRLTAPQAPVAIGIATSTGSALVVMDTDVVDSRSDAAAYDPVTNSWISLPSASTYVPAPEDLIWTGKNLLVYGHGLVAQLR